MINIGGLQKLTLIDYPGHIAATVFLIGCNFRCPFCYNPELVLPKKIKKHPVISEKEFFDFLKERQGLLEGVVLCGGEPCISDSLPQFCKKIKSLGYLVKLDTNGSRPKMLKKLFSAHLVDYVAMDIKSPKEKYNKAAGVKVNFGDIKKSVEILKNSAVEYEFRTTVVPGIHTKEDIIQIAREISPAKKYFLQNFQPKKTIDLKFEKIKPYSEEYILEIQKAAAPFFDICEIR